MTIGTTNISVNGIFNEANPGAGTPNDESVGDLFRYSYFEGPNGSNTISYNAWGQQGTTLGADRIYGLTAKNNNLQFSDYSGLTYFYDNSTFTADVRVRNTTQAPPFPPPNPPSANDFVVEVKVYDSTGTYFYLFQTINANAQVGGYDQTFTISVAGSSPLIAIAYWEIGIGTDQGFPGPASVTIDINGTNIVTGSGLTMSQPPSGNLFSYTGFSTINVNATGLYFDIQIF